MVEKPERDDENWIRHISVEHTPDGPKLGNVPVTITQWQPQVRSY